MPISRRLCLIALLLVMIGVPSMARAQELESVTLRGRVLRPDSAPLANWPLYVDAVEPGPFGSGTGKSTRYNGRTDGQGNYSFTFPFAKAPGQQTDTDYYLRVKMPSSVHAGQEIGGEYELELLEREHNAPDLVLWDPAFSVATTDRSFTLNVTPRPGSKNLVDAFIDNERIMTSPGNSIDRRDTEDVSVLLTPRAYADIASAGTIYHQRFSTTRAPARGSLVPLSRGAACTATFENGSTSSCARYTDGDLRAPEEAPASWPETVLVDLGSTQTVGDVRARSCGCIVTVSADGTHWTAVTASGSPVRYVRLTQKPFLQVSHISVWPPGIGASRSPSRSTPPTTARVAPTPLATTPPAPTPLAPPATFAPSTTSPILRAAEPAAHDARGADWPVRILGLGALVAVSYMTIDRARRATNGWQTMPW